MKSNVPSEVSKVRRDLTGYCFHFLRRDPDPVAAMRSILSEGTLRGRTYRPASIPTICFTDAPLSEVTRQDEVLETLGYERLSLWGIGFRKGDLFQRGARPVIYQDPSELKLLDRSIWWRHVDFDPSKVDFTWQREWRLQADRLTFTSQEVVLVIPDVSRLVRDLWYVSIDVDVSDGEASLYAQTCKKWDFVPLEHADISDDKSIEVCRTEDWHDIISEEYYDKMEYNGP
jgi:hypothetical protein